MAIPSPRFFKEMILNTNYDEIEFAQINIKSQIKWMLSNLRDEEWILYFDVFEPQYIGMHVQFDSWQELSDIINQKNIDNVIQRHLRVVNETMIRHKKEQDEKWDEFYNFVL